MTHNRGKRYIPCPTCNRRRYCSHRGLPNDYREWTCSKGHVWSVPMPTLERASIILKEQVLPKVLELFNRDDVFFSKLKRTR